MLGPIRNSNEKRTPFDIRIKNDCEIIFHVTMYYDELISRLRISLIQLRNPTSETAHCRRRS